MSDQLFAASLLSYLILPRALINNELLNFRASEWKSQLAAGE
jgi:hypothetical protein